ncbi:serine hydrolase domain-containing protein [Methylobacterium radiodurans]|uniref:Serine hydrolase n=1 Tax=Methylobacterium radiodurans TaxID=2202828 RepID=A0A2U8VP85_9HYPH|nr:serine hydrolase [Methylobacterium radiodurans]AWN35196.1 serine hydrolase [Methylobacterium radiodurans]
MSRSIRSRYLCFALSLALVAGPATNGSAAESSPEPGIGIASPEDVGVDSTALVRMSEWIRKDRLDVRSLLVIKDGKLIFERYSHGLDRDYNYELYSVTKTVTALNVGILADQGKIGIEDEVAPWILKQRPEFGAAARDKAGIRLRHLMSMSSGLLYRQVEGSDPLYFQAPDRVSVALSAKPRIPPATEFEYTDANPVLVGIAIQAASGEPEHEFAEARLFRPLGMRNARWTGRDGTGSVSGGWGLRLRAIDMAKIGMLMLQDGEWEGRRIVSKAWIRQMTAASETAMDYGLYTWINHVVESEPEFGAMGFKGQFITVLPKQNAVVVMTGILPTDGGLRTATYLNLYRRMVNDFVLPAMHAVPKPAFDEARRKALKRELELAAQTRGEPGTGLAFNDGPER